MTQTPKERAKVVMKAAQNRVAQIAQEAVDFDRLNAVITNNTSWMNPPAAQGLQTAQAQAPQSMQDQIKAWQAFNKSQWQSQHEVEVTEEMIAAGRAAMDSAYEVDCGATAIYRAMAALAPVPLVSDGELAALKERDEEKSLNLHLMAVNTQLSEELATLRTRVAERDASVAHALKRAAR